MKRKMLPNDLIAEIFSRLPVDSLVRFTCLSKPFLQILADPQFFGLHLHNHPNIRGVFLLKIKELGLRLLSISTCLNKMEFEPSNAVAITEIVGSCNGLLCVIDSSQVYRIKILNPSIRRFKILPADYSDPDPSVIGFGYDSSNNDFKVVKIVFHGSRSAKWKQVNVFSLAKNSWKVLTKQPAASYKLLLHRPTLVYNGAFHWIAREPSSKRILILMFDFVEEAFREIQVPICFRSNHIGIGEIRGKLALLRCVNATHSYEHDDYAWCSSDTYRFELWLLMESSNWVKHDFEVTTPQLPLYGLRSANVLPECFGMNGEVLLIKARCNRFFFYDLTTMTLTECGVRRRIFYGRALIHTSSLALLEEESFQL